MEQETKPRALRAEGSPVPAAETSLSPRGGAKHRRMKERILQSLQGAGEDGKTIAEIATELGVLKARVQSWFSSTGKKCPRVRKIGEARWRIVE